MPCERHPRRVSMHYQFRWLKRMERKYGRYAISNLMTIIVGGMAIVFVMSLLAPVNLTGLLAFDRNQVLRGQIWRLFSFIIIPPATSLLFIIFSLYFYWLLGSALENEWGSFKFNVFYLCGIVSTIVAGLITGYATNFYINMSLFLAFAILNPNFQLMMFFIIPVKVKYLAYIDAAFFLYMLVINNWAGRIVLLISVLNLILFFWQDGVNLIKQANRRAKWKRSIRR